MFSAQPAPKGVALSGQTRGTDKRAYEADMKTRLEKGLQSLEISLPDEQVLDVIVGRTVPAIDLEDIRVVISQGIRTHSPADITRRKIAVIIPDDTRLWARGDICVPEIVRTLLEMGVQADQIRIIIALGTHQEMKEEDFSTLAGTFCAGKITILNSANQDQGRLVYFGETLSKTPLFFTREAAESDHIIIFGGILHHLIAGFGGGRKYLLPGIAGHDSIQKNHSLAIRADGTPHPLARQAMLQGNPVHEDLNDAARIFLKDKTCTCVTVAANGTGDIFHAAVGPLHETFMDGCRILDEACCIRVPRRGDFALISAGGHRTDGQLYQATKALFNAVNIVREGGDILFVAGCGQGVGSPSFAAVLKDCRGRPEKIGKELVRHFSMPSYVAFRTLSLLKSHRITLVSDLSRAETEALGFNYAEDIRRYVENLEGRGYIVPYAENILPLAEE